MLLQEPWSEGDRVLAPWEPDWLYPGTIRCIDEEIAFVRFDDGDRALVPVRELEPIAIDAGDEVYGRLNRHERLYYPAEVLDVNDEEVRLRYDDGREELTTVSFLRVPRRPLAVEGWSN
jgi:hypothetical protein